MKNPHTIIGAGLWIVLEKRTSEEVAQAVVCEYLDAYHGGATTVVYYKDLADPQHPLMRAMLRRFQVKQYPNQ